MWRIFMLVCVAGAMQAHWGDAFAAPQRDGAERDTSAASLPLTLVTPFAPPQGNLLSPRIALVIGNGAYGADGVDRTDRTDTQVDALRENAPRDAEAMRDRLQTLGFDVIMRMNATPAANARGHWRIPSTLAGRRCWPLLFRGTRHANRPANTAHPSGSGCPLAG
ncbi:hypothetical protein B0G74_5971 [Paraburkholderia sp. BL9I2N2]|nr:hypothetical protein B0G74_5971 [Paraburkholderia sp. BL9I2N2]